MPKSLCFTGHRNPGNSTFTRTALANAIERAIRRGFTRFICGGAIGSDWIATEEVIRAKSCFLNVELVLALPCRGYNDRWGEPTKKAWASILAQADEVHYVTTLGAGESPEAWMFHRRNHWMVNEADVVVAVYDGRDNGGTATTVSYARITGKRVYRIDPVTKSEEWVMPIKEIAR